MNSTTSFAFTSFSMNFSMAMDLRSCWAAPRAEGAFASQAALLPIYVAQKWPLPQGGMGMTPVSPANPPETAGKRAGRSGLQRQGVQHAAHLAFERLIDQLMLLDPGFALERRRNHGRRVVVAVTGKIADRHFGVRNARFDQPLDFAGIHRHLQTPLPVTIRRRQRIRQPHRPNCTQIVPGDKSRPLDS